MRKINFIFLSIAMTVSATILSAGPTAGENEINRAALQVQRKMLVEKNMKLDPTTAKVFWPLYDEYTEAMKKPNDRATALLNDFAANSMDLTDEKAESLLVEFMAVKQEQLDVKKSFAKKFLKELPPKVAARFFQVDNKIDALAANELAQNVPLVH